MRAQMYLGTAVVLAALCAGWFATRPLSLIVIVAGVVAVALLLAPLDGWQRLNAAAIFLLFGATSTFATLVEAAYYPRYAVTLALAIWTWRTTEGRPVRHLADLGLPVRWLVTGMWLALIVSVASIVWSFDRQATALQSVALATLVVLLHGLVTRRWTNREQVVADLSVPVLLMSVIFAAGIAAELTGVAVTRDALSGRFYGLFQNPNMLGLTAAMILPLAAGLIVCGKRWWLYVVAAIPAILSLVMSESRTALVAVIVGAAFLLLRMRGPGRIPALYIAIIIAVIGYAFTVSRGIGGAVASVAGRFTANEGGDLLNTRTDAWRDAIELWQQQPLQGYGYSAGPSLFESRRAGGRSNFGSDVVHNSYLQWLLELGVAGLVPLGMLLVACVAAAFIKAPASLALGLVPAVVAGLAVQMTESAMFGTGQPYPFIFWPVVAATLIFASLPATQSVPEAAQHAA